MSSRNSKDIDHEKGEGDLELNNDNKIRDHGKDEGVVIATKEKPAGETGRSITGFRWALVIFSLLSSIFLFSLDNTIVADLVPILVQDFHAVDQLTWLSVGFTLGAVVLALTFGNSVINAKWLFIGSSTLFQATSILCGAAPNVQAEITGRVFAGIGGNGMYLGTLTLLIKYTTDLERGGYLASIGIVWGLGTVLGPIVGGGLAAASWRWAFYINPMIGVFCIAICVFFIPATDPTPGTSYSVRLRRFDYLGSILLSGAMTFLVLAINFGGVLYSWKSVEVIVFFIIALLLFAAFAVQQGLSLLVQPNDRLFPVHFLKNQNAVLLFICASASNVAAFVPIYYIPIYFQFTRGDTALESAVRLLPLIFLLSATIFTSGQIIVRWGSFQDWYIGGFILSLIGNVLMSRLDENTPISMVYGWEVLIAFGAGAVVQAGYTVIYLFTAPEDGAYAVSFMSLAQLGGMALGLSIAGCVFVNKAVVNLASQFPDLSHAELVEAASGKNSLVFDGLSAEDGVLAVHNIVLALREAFIPAYVAAAVGLLCAIFITRQNIGKVMAGLQAVG